MSTIGIGTRPIVEATLPGRSFVDPGIFEQEREWIFSTMWM
jgi:hypothetical protein